MTKNKHPYSILGPSEMRRRSSITLIPEEQLDPLMRAELHNLRKGIQYKFTIADTPENRENFNVKALYFQMVAYKEGWRFDPKNLQVMYIPPGDPRFPQDGRQRRFFEFKGKSAYKKVPLSPLDEDRKYLPYRISQGGRLGFTIDDNTASVTQMRPEEADDLGGKVIKLFR